MKKILFAAAIILILFLSGCSQKQSGNVKIANPASVYCEEQGGKLEIKTDSDGGQAGYCNLGKGIVCEEWAYYRGECPKATEISLENNGLKVLISPVDGKKLKGIVAVKIESVPSGSSELLVMLSQQGITINDPFNTPNVITQLAEPTATEILLDTSKVENGVYNIAVTAKKPEDIKDEKMPWLAVVQTQVAVEN
jgi:putative hemolysin